MQDLSLNKRQAKALVLVAHPDDETIWMGGTLLRHRNIKWTIFSLCRRDDTDRQPKFLKVCKAYGAKAIISDLEDEGILSLKKSVPEIKERVNELLKLKKFDYLFTHGVNGEYGHIRHKGVHQATQELVKENKLEFGQIFYFCYKGENQSDNSQATNNLSKAKYGLRLTNRELKQKREIVNKLYGFTKISFEYLSCSNLETFY